jgi:uncharacterized protein YciI
MFVVTISYTAPMDQIDARRAEHREWLDSHISSGLFLVTGPMIPRSGGVLVASGRISRDDLNALLSHDPFQLHGLAHYSIVEFEANKMNPALADLV